MLLEDISNVISLLEALGVWSRHIFQRHPSNSFMFDSLNYRKESYEVL
jgi:hypothetical protein